MNVTTAMRAERNETILLDASDWVLALQETAAEQEDLLAHYGNPVQSTPSMNGC